MCTCGPAQCFGGNNAKDSPQLNLAYYTATLINFCVAKTRNLRKLTDHTCDHTPFDDTF